MSYFAPDPKCADCGHSESSHQRQPRELVCLRCDKRRAVHLFVEAQQ